MAKESWNEHNRKVMYSFIQALSIVDNISIAEIMDKWKNEFGISTFAIYIEIDGMDDCFAKLSKRGITFGRMNSQLPFNIMQKIISWYKEEVGMNTYLCKTAFNVYSKSANKMLPFIQSISKDTRYEVLSAETDDRNVMIKLKEIDH